MAGPNSIRSSRTKSDGASLPLSPRYRSQLCGLTESLGVGSPIDGGKLSAGTRLRQTLDAMTISPAVSWELTIKEANE